MVLYIVATRLAVTRLHLSYLLPAALTDAERRVGGVFVAGALAQLLFVCVSLTFIARMRQAVAASVRTATRHGWFIALAAGAMQCAAISLFFLPHSTRLVEVSVRNVVLSIAPLIDGWSQEVVFRGYLMLRLADARLPRSLLVLVSGAAFAAIHVGYLGGSIRTAVWPLVGTFTFGAVLAISVFAARGSLKPAVVAHMLVIAVIQPWLALAQ